MKECQNIKIKNELFKKIKNKAKELDFSVDEYIEFVLKEILREKENIKHTKEDEEIVKKRLKELGYIE